MKTRLSDIVSHLRQLSSNSNTTTAKTFVYNVILNCFQNHCHLLNSQKQTKAPVFQSKPKHLPCFELNYKFLERHKKPLSLVTTRKQGTPVNMAQKMASKSSTKQDGEATTGEVPGSIVTYTEEKINTFKDDMASENTKKSTSTSVRLLQSWYLEKYETELNLNSISKTFRGIYFILIAMSNFQCFRLDISFLSVLPQKRQKV